MLTAKRYSFPQRIERIIRYSFSCLVSMMFSPNHTKIFGGKYLENSKGTPTFLNAGGSYPNAPLTLVIWADARKEFKNKPEEYYAGKSVCVTGKIELFKDKPQIVINKEEQIRETINDKLIINEPR